jgi:hypothetical protein
MPAASQSATEQHRHTCGLVQGSSKGGMRYHKQCSQE